MNIQLPLKKKWFEMTQQGIKKEDYREITPYFCNMFLLYNNKKQSKFFWETEFLKYGTIEEVVENIRLFTTFISPDKNIMTLGYPSKKAVDKILTYSCKGLEIGYGKQEWGAEPNKLYFVIKHGGRL